MRRMLGLSRMVGSLVLVVMSTACAQSPQAQGRGAAGVDIAELWQEPADLGSRDLFLGPGGAALAPAEPEAPPGSCWQPLPWLGPESRC